MHGYIYPLPNPRFPIVFPLRLIGLQSAKTNNNMVSVIIKSHTDTHAYTNAGGGSKGRRAVLKAVPACE